MIDHLILAMLGAAGGVYVGAYFASRGWRLRAIEDAQLITALRADREQLQQQVRHLRAGGRAVVAVREGNGPEGAA